MLFMIGNGFDLNCGLKTSYMDVYEKYIKEPSGNSTIDLFKSEIESDIENWGDFEIALAKYASRLKNEEELLDCIRDFKVYIKDYLTDQENQFKKVLKDERVSASIEKEMRESVFGFYKGISPNVDRMIGHEVSIEYTQTINVISFNYTRVFDLVLNRYAKKYYFVNVNHVHGSLEDEIALGIDNEEQIRVSYSISEKGKRGLIKPYFNGVYDSNRISNAKSMMDNERVICVYGASLGDSDLFWRKCLIEWLNKSGNNHLFIYDFKLSNVDARTDDEKMDIEDDRKEDLFIKWGIKKEENISSQIHIPCGKNIFNINDIITNET